MSPSQNQFGDRKELVLELREWEGLPRRKKFFDMNLRPRIARKAETQDQESELGRKNRKSMT